MTHSKLDARLLAALSGRVDADEGSIDVFIDTGSAPADAAQSALLKSLGVNLGARPQTIFTAALPPKAIAVLSDQPWVRAVRFSGQSGMRGAPTMSPRHFG